MYHLMISKVNFMTLRRYSALILLFDMAPFFDPLFFFIHMILLDVKGINLDTEKLFAYRAVSMSFLSM